MTSLLRLCQEDGEERESDRERGDKFVSSVSRRWRIELKKTFADTVKLIRYFEFFMK